ncbi:unnamed protein product [Kuraishia capsulata CBS 1993]|uniref:PITH domain-containing protein n=1 Tax=Kuraishia capsulata CBS 1993 TaxID=1382522 RepID=W6MPZ1_9ASCO|nr:uncharacterized protein KUCA_T00004715001 [Kuraishia capsulata CBS 1993]CDK28731.1 unnamed protein product [Kuraishia capsulata CBS 1993]
MPSCGHSHSHGHSHGPPPIPTNSSQSINDRVSLSKLAGLNMANPPSDLQALFKTRETKNSLRPAIRSDADNQLILKVPFDGIVKLYSIILRTNGQPDHCPSTIKLFKNNDALDFDTIGSVHPTSTLSHPLVGHLEDLSAISRDDELVDETEDQFVEHYLPRNQFNGTTSLTLFFEDTHSHDEDEPVIIYSVELRGEFAELTRDPVITLYESAANPADHKLPLSQQNLNSQGFD